MIHNPNLIGNVEQLQNSVASVEGMMRRLDKIVNGSPHKSASRYLHTPRAPKQGKSLLEQIATPLLKGVFSSLAGSSGSGSSRTSQGQMMSDFASAMARASKRYL